MNKDLTATQNDYAHFLPALSGFYATYVGKQRFPDPVKGPYIEDDRIPANWNSGVESLNYLNSKEGAFTYKWTLYSAGHADLDTAKIVPKEDMVRNRDRANTWLLGDSGGFQIGKGVWEGDWKDPNCPKAQKKRDGVLRWMDAYMDYGMILDIPAWVARSPEGAAATGISTYQEAVKATRINNDYWMKHRTGACKLLNVLQGENHTDAAACLTGAAMQRVPSSLSSSSTAYPFCRTISNRSRIAVSSIRVCGVRCWRGIASRFVSSLSPRCAIKHCPSAVQNAGLI